MAKIFSFFIIVLLIIFSVVTTGYGSVETPRVKLTQNKDYISLPKIYVDSIGADSAGFSMLIRPYRPSALLIKPSIVDIKFGLMDGKKVIYSDTIKQKSLFEPTEITENWKIALENGKNYTFYAQIYLYENGEPNYINTYTSNFTATMDAKITDVYGDGIGASATLKSESMVPLNAKVLFVLVQNGKILQTREADAPMIMLNDEEKTIDILWNSSLSAGKYMVITELIGEQEETIDKHDKVFEVENIPMPTATAILTKEKEQKSTPGFTSFYLIFAIIIMVAMGKRLRMS